MTIRLVDPVDVVVSPDLTITEYIGRIASQDAVCSACVATVTAATKEAPQRPAFDEYVLILEGEVHIMHGEGLTERTVVKAGQGFVLPAGTRVQWVWPGVWLLHAHAARRARKSFLSGLVRPMHRPVQALACSARVPRKLVRLWHA